MQLTHLVFSIALATNITIAEPPQFTDKELDILYRIALG